MAKLNKKLKTKWVKTLRSGRYLQCTNRLSDGNGFCCLGVLAKIQRCRTSTLVNAEKKMNDQVLEGMLTDHLKHYSGGLSNNQQYKLVDLNDTDRLAFEEIADYIEKHY